MINSSKKQSLGSYIKIKPNYDNNQMAATVIHCLVSAHCSKQICLSTVQRETEEGWKKKYCNAIKFQQ